MGVYLISFSVSWLLKLLGQEKNVSHQNNENPGGFSVQRSIRGRAAEMGLKISLL